MAILRNLAVSLFRAHGILPLSKPLTYSVMISTDCCPCWEFSLPNMNQPCQVGELDELETFVGNRQNKLWIWTAVDHFAPGILGWTVGLRSSSLCGVIIVRQPFARCGRRLHLGSAISGSVMVIQFIQALFPQAIRLSVKLI